MTIGNFKKKETKALSTQFTLIMLIANNLPVNQQPLTFLLNSHLFGTFKLSKRPNANERVADLYKQPNLVLQLGHGCKQQQKFKTLFV